MAEEQVYTPKEIADRYKVTPAAVLKWIHEGRLRAVRLGKVWRIPESALEDFIKKSVEK